MTKWSLSALGQSGFAIAVGPSTPLQLIVAENSLDGTPALPLAIPFLPYPTWEIELDDNTTETLTTDDESQRLVMANFRRRGLRLVGDYHHQTLYAADKGYVAEAAVWATELFADKTALWGTALDWTADGSERVLTKKLLYISPVALVDKNLRVFALHSFALTNVPRTNNQQPLTDAVAAEILSGCMSCYRMEEGGMDQLFSIIISLLSRTWDSTIDDILEDTTKAMKALEAIKALSESERAAAMNTIAAAVKLTAGGTVLEGAIAAGLKLPASVTIAAAAGAVAPAIPGDLYVLAGLPATSTVEQLSARLVDLATRPTREELTTVSAELTTLRTAGETSRVDAMINTYADRFVEPERVQLTKLAASSSANFAAVESSLKARQPIVQRSIAANTAPPAPELSTETTSTTVKVAGDETRRAVPESAARANQVKAILAEKLPGIDTYAGANEELYRRERAVKN